jgi:hypothetical protein
VAGVLFFGLSVESVDLITQGVRQVSKATEREQFLMQLAREFPDKSAYDIGRIGRLLLRHSVSHGRNAEAQCNGPGDYVNRIEYPRAGEIYAEHEARCEKREAALEKRMTALATELGCAIQFQGDPRGWTVRLMLNDGRELGVPQ